MVSDRRPSTDLDLLPCLISYPPSVQRLQLWDTAGQERFRSMAPLFFRDSDAAILVYDITDRQTLDEIPAWVEDLKRLARDECRVIYLVGNKRDLEEKRQVTKQDAARCAANVGATLFDREISALSDEGIEELFKEVSWKLANRMAVRSKSLQRQVTDDSLDGSMTTTMEDRRSRPCCI